MLDANLQGMARGGSRLSYGLLVEWEDGMNIQGGRTATARGGDKDVSWSGEGVGDQVGLISRRSQGSRLGCTKQDITDCIVA